MNMSQDLYHINHIMSFYYTAEERYAQLLALSEEEPMNIPILLHAIHNCHQTIENIILVESSSSYLVALQQIKNHLSDLSDFLRTKSLYNGSYPNKKTKCSVQSEEKDDKKFNLIEASIQTSRVEGFKEVAGLTEIKKLLKVHIILPKTQPQLFIGKKVLNSILLFGPPGTGKTHLIRALSFEAKAPLYCVTASNIVSSLVGQTERNIKNLFEYVKTRDTFSLLFIDEVDGFCIKRSGSEPDNCRRLKTELLCQISDLSNNSNVFLICATNCPWDLDTAFLRRFQKRIFVPLPNHTERYELFKLYTKSTPLEETFRSWEELISKTEGWCASDISDMIQEAMRIPLLELEETKIWKNCEDGLYEPLTQRNDLTFKDITYSDLNLLPPRTVRARKVDTLDLYTAFNSKCSTVNKADLEKYKEFYKQ